MQRIYSNQNYYNQKFIKLFANEILRLKFFLNNLFKALERNNFRTILCI